MTKNWQSHNRMNVAIIAGEKDEVLYNKAVELLNRANKYYNEFIDYRNMGFRPQKSQGEMREMLLPVLPLLKEAFSHINEMGRHGENFQYNPENILQRISSLEKRTGEQAEFLNVYLATSPGKRDKLLLE